MKDLVILDLDNVIIKGQSQQYFLGYLFEKKLIGLFFYFKIYIWFFLYKFGFSKNPKRIMEYAFSFLKGVDAYEINRIIDIFFEERLRKFIFREMLDIIKKHKDDNRELIIVSNAAEIIVKRIAEFLKIKNYIGTELEIKENKFTGRIIGDIIYGDNKEKAVKDFINKNNLAFKNTWGYADHISDLDLLLFVDHPFVVNPDTLLRREARKRNWDILLFNI